MTPPAPRSSARWSPRSQASGADVREGWLATDLLVEDGRVAGVHARSDPTAPDERAGPPRRDRDRRRRAVLRRHHQPGALDRRRHRHGPARRRRRRRPRVHAVPPDRAAPPVDAAAAPLRGAARRGRDPARRARRSRSWRDEHPLADLAPRDVVAKAISRRLIERDLDHLWLDATAIDDFPARFPTIWEACRSGRARPDARLAPGRARRPLPLGRGVHRPRRRHDPARACGRAARRRAPACTARTAWRRTRCSTGSCSRRAAVEAIVDGKDGCRCDRRAARRPLTRAGRSAAAASRQPGSGDPRRAATGDDPRRGRASGARTASSARPTRSASIDPDRRREREPARGQHRPRPGRDRAPRVARARTPAPTTRSRRPRSSAVSSSPAHASAEFVPLATEHESPPSRGEPVNDFDAPAHVVRALVAAALAEDLGPLGDLTAALVPADVTRDRRRRGPRRRRDRRHRVRHRGVRPARPAASRCDWLVDDGDAVGRGAKVGEVSGPAALAAHRRAHRAELPVPPVGGGVAHPPVRARRRDRRRAIWDTRKTLPGLRAVEKAAVRAGGGVNHRGSLSEFVLVKDNHLAGLGITDAVAPGPRAVAGAHGRGRVRPRRRRSQEAIAAGRDDGPARQHDPRRGARLRRRWRAPPRPRASWSRSPAASRSTTCAPTPMRAPTSSPPASSRSRRRRSTSRSICARRARPRGGVSHAAGHRLRQHPDRHRSVLRPRARRPLAHRHRRRAHLRRARADVPAVPRLPRLLVRRARVGRGDRVGRPARHRRVCAR